MLRIKYLFENYDLARECLALYDYDEESLEEMLSYFRVSYRGRAMAIIRSGYESGSANVKVSAEGMEPVQVELQIVGSGN